jgi:transcriptional regulator NrdR family protein
MPTQRESERTRLHCPHCKNVTTTRSTGGPTARPTEHSGVHYYRRRRTCLNCNRPFSTGEVDEGVLRRLAEAATAIHNVREQTKEPKRAGRIYDGLDAGSLLKKVADLGEQLDALHADLKQAADLERQLWPVVQVFDAAVYASKRLNGSTED